MTHSTEEREEKRAFRAIDDIVANCRRMGELKSYEAAVLRDLKDENLELANQVKTLGYDDALTYRLMVEGITEIAW